MLRKLLKQLKVPFMTQIYLNIFHQQQADISCYSTFLEYDAPADDNCQAMDN